MNKGDGCRPFSQIMIHATPADRRPTSPALEAYLLGPVDFASALALQQRLVFEASGDQSGKITLLVCEHPPLVTIGRQGSRGDVQIDVDELERKRLEVRWVNRGGGAILHLPGQLAVYPIVPLEWYGWKPGNYLELLHTGLQEAIDQAGVATHLEADRAGLWGRSGLLAAVGVAIKTGVSYFGAYINVEPTIAWMRRVRTDPTTHQPMSSLAVERRHGVRMTTVRESVVRHLAAAFGAPRYHIYSRHPLLVRKATVVVPETISRVG